MKKIIFLIILIINFSFFLFSIKTIHAAIIFQQLDKSVQSNLVGFDSELNTRYSRLVQTLRGNIYPYNSLSGTVKTLTVNLKILDLPAIKPDPGFYFEVYNSYKVWAEIVGSYNAEFCCSAEIVESKSDIINLNSSDLNIQKNYIFNFSSPRAFDPNSYYKFQIKTIHQLYFYGSPDSSSYQQGQAGIFEWNFLDTNVKDAYFIIEDTLQNQPPTISNINQYKSDGVTLITENSTTTESTVVFKASLNDADNDQIKFQVELKEYNQSFNEQDLLESSFVSSGSEAVVSRQSLVDGFYKWRARAIDNKGNASDWQKFGTAGNVDFEVKLVPLYTQVRSPYPSEAATDEWSRQYYAYANPSEDKGYNCGFTIAKCGCGITSAVMIGRYYKITESINKNDVNPGTINKWLSDNNGYQKSKNEQINGNIAWDGVIMYLGFIDEKGKEMKRLELVYNKEAKDFYKFGASKIEEHIRAAKPIIAFKKELGHLFITDGQIFDDITATSTYTIKDPMWYKTARLNQQKTYDQNGKVEIQSYDNAFTNARLFDYLAAPKRITGSITLMVGSPVELLVTDPQGRKLGKDPITNIFYGEIPDGLYTAENILSSELELPDPPDTTKILYIPESLSGQYDVKIIGTDTGKYVFNLLAYDENGQSLSAVSEGMAEFNNIQTFQLNYSATTTQKTEIYHIIAIDIKPGGYPNSISLNSKGVIPVAILTTPFFDAKEVIINSVIFDGAKFLKGDFEDVDGDGDLDLILHFNTQFLNLTLTDTEAVLTGKLNDGSLIKGIDSVKIIGK